MIVDSSSLIIFAKLNKLELLLKLYNKIYITKEVYKEVVEEGMIINAPDAIILKDYINNNIIEILELNKEYLNFSKSLKKIYYQLGFGETESIALALQEKNKIIIMDESIGRSVAKLYNLKPIGSLRILLESYKKSFIDETELKNIIDEMIKNKFRIGADVINEFWNIFYKLKKRGFDKDLK